MKNDAETFSNFRRECPCGIPEGFRALILVEPVRGMHEKKKGAEEKAAGGAHLSVENEKKRNKFSPRHRARIILDIDSFRANSIFGH